MITQDLGIATAYGYAKSKGYTGTEAEFAELMADYAEVGQRAEDAADSAMESKTAAQTAATTATNKASEATTAATTATTKAGEASTSASTATSAKDTAVSASQTATSKANEATTAAATATSAKTDAVAANTAAQSAKTAAQTAQTGAETAAASVSASAAQIATNTDDIAQLKSDLSAVTKCDLASFNPIFVAGKTIGSTGRYEDNAQRIATPSFANVSGFDTLKYSIINGYRVLVAFYSAESESSFVSSKYWLTGSGTIPVASNFARVAYASLNDETALTPSDSDKITIAFSYKLLDNVNQSLSDINAMMQAKTVGSNLNFILNRTVDSAGNFDYFAGRIATEEFVNITDKTGIVYNVTEGYRCLIAFYSEASTSSFVGSRYWLVGNGTITKQANYYRVAYASLNDATPLTVADASKITLSYTYPLYDDIAESKYIPIQIRNDLVSDGMDLLPNTKVIKNGIASNTYYGMDNVRYQIALPKHNKLHISFDYKYTAKVPYVASGYIDLFQYGGVLHGSERHLTMGQFGILPYRITTINGRGTTVNSIILNNDYMQRQGSPSFLITYTGQYTSSSSIQIAIGSSTLTIKDGETTLGTVNYSGSETIQSLIDKLNEVSNISCDAIETNGTVSDLLLIDGNAIYLKPECIVSFGWDNTWHNFEIVIDKTKSMYYMAFDGATITGSFASPNDNTVYIGGDFNGSTLPLRLRNLEIDINTLGDAEIISAPVSANATENTIQLISKHNPRLMIFEGHGVIVGSEAYAQTLTGEDSRLAASTDRLNAVFAYVKSQGYVPVSWKDVIAWKQGKTSLPKRCFVIMMDDYRVENYVDYDKRRPFVKHGVFAGLAMISDQHQLTDVMTINGESYTVESIFKMIELAGWYPCSHTRNHRINSDYTSTQLIEEFKADVLSCDKHGIYSDVLVYPYGATGYTTLSTMRLSDFAIGVDVDNGGTLYNCKGINTYKFQRTELGTRASLDKVLAPFV